MSIKFRCTCGKAYKVDDAHAGRKMVCKGCGKKLKIPGGVEAAVSAGDSFEFSNELPDRSPKGAAPPPLVSGKRKKRKPAEEPSPAKNPSAGRKTLLIGGLALFGLLGIGGIAYVVISAGGGGGGAADAPAAPQQYIQFAAEEGGFKCEYPESWTAEQGGGTGGRPPWARFEDGTATIEIRGSASGSAVSDIVGAGQTPGGLDEMDDDLSPVAKVHEFQKSKIEANYQDYEEKPGENIDIPWGEVRISEFTASEGFLGGNVQGYRVTLTGVQWQFNMVCTCPTRKWEEYQPIFDHVVHAVAR